MLRVHLWGLSVLPSGALFWAQMLASRCMLNHGLSLAVQLVSMRECEICVVAGGGGRPKGLKDETRAVRAEWLLAVAESLKKPMITQQYLIDTD